MCTLVCACMKLYGTKLLHKSRRIRLKRRLIIIFVSLKNCAFMENLNSDININVIWSCTIMKLIYWGLTLRFTASSAIKYHERKGKENEMKRNEMKRAWRQFLVLAFYGSSFRVARVRYSLDRQLNCAVATPCTVQGQSWLCSKFFEESRRRWGSPYTLYICTLCIHVCTRMCELVYLPDDVVWAMAN